MNNWQKYEPHAHIILWLFIAVLLIWKLTPFIDAILEAISEKKEDGTRGKVSIKRIIPFIFTLLICYMVVGYMHTGGVFNQNAFWGLLLFIALSTTVITVTQAQGLIDQLSTFKNKITNTKVETTEQQITKTQ